ncbi:hypothetical protein BpHYR1_000378 [Brachionus plicatilis]|uniref:Uncharacterized protein n=1 Tax=Brachionus plicatilis TaxID=10195 RepID=A0A3M7Q4U7_BRAPC|nr:hypothetical protein BpHYR1_000378 [Brachionus plicatilis]
MKLSNFCNTPNICYWVSLRTEEYNFRDFTKAKQISINFNTQMTKFFFTNQIYNCQIKDHKKSGQFLVIYLSRSIACWSSDLKTLFSLLQKNQRKKAHHVILYNFKKLKVDKMNGVPKMTLLSFSAKKP